MQPGLRRWNIQIASRERQRHLILAVLWLVFTVGFALLRSSTVLVWDDSPRLAANLYDSPQPLVWSGPETLNTILLESFAHITSSGYRPLSQFISLLGITYFSSFDTSHALWFAGIGAIIGLLSLAAFSVSRWFLGSDRAALLALFLFVFSTPFITGSWIVFAGIQALVPLIICGGLIVYWRITGNAKHRQIYIISLFLILSLGPWFREFIGILPLLILFLEIQQHRRATVLVGFTLVFLMHALFPTAVVKLTFFPDLPLHSVFSMGSLGDQVSVALSGANDSFFSQIRRRIRWEVPRHFLSLFPSFLLFMVLIVLVMPAVRILTRLLKGQPDAINELKDFKQYGLGLRSIVSFAFALGLITTLLVYWFGNGEYGILLWLCAGIAFAGLNRDAFLPWWFTLSFFPFFSVFTEQVHLAYSVLPASIIIVAALEDLWRYIRQRAIVLRSIFIVILVWATGDHLLNLYGSYKVVRTINDGILDAAAWFRSNVPSGSLVVTNALHAEDIRLFSGGHITVLWTVQAGIPHPNKAVDEPAKLEALLEENQGRRSVYFLDVSFDYTPDKVKYHSHKYVWDQSVAVEKLGLVHTTRAHYPYLDPAKAFVSRSYISFLGAPDLENDFYRGPAQDGTPFMREVYAEYHVYKVVGTSVHPWNSRGSVQLHREGYRGFNILVLNGRFFAVPQSEGAFELQKIENKLYSISFVADNYDDILRQIDTLLEKSEAIHFDVCASSSLRRINAATLIEEGYRRYNIVGYAGRLYAIPQGEGSFEIERIRRSDYTRWFTGCSLESVKQQLDQSLSRK